MPEVLPIVKVEGRLGQLTDMRSCEAEGMEKMRQEDAVSGARDSRRRLDGRFIRYAD
jgi:hypothetical protein